MKTKKKQQQQKHTFSLNDYHSNDGMLTTVWGPAQWHMLHTMSFNYPNEPTNEDKKYYMLHVKNLVHVLPCKYCRMNLKKNLRKLPLTLADMKNRDSFSRYVYKLHELVNKMLGKTSGLTFEQVRERYEHFRSRCTIDKDKIKEEIEKISPKTPKKEKGCTEPLYGKKSKCVIRIVPVDEKTKTFDVNPKCIKTRIPSRSRSRSHSKTLKRR